VLLNILPSHLSVARVSYGKTGEWIRMPFGVVSGVKLGMGLLDFGGDRRRKGTVLGMNLGHPILTNGAFVASLCGSAYSDRAVVWQGEWGGRRHSCIRWKSTCLKGKGLFLACFLAFFSICVCIRLNGRNDVRNVFDSCVKSWQYFHTDIIPLNSVNDWLSDDIVRFKIEVEIDQKCTKTLTLNTRKMAIVAIAAASLCGA